MPKTQQTNTDNKERFEMSAKTNRQWRLASRPQGLVKGSDFQWCEEPVSSVGPHQVLVRNLYLSMDPAQRVWVRPEEGMMPPVAIGELMRGITIGVVEESRHPAYAHADYLNGTIVNHWMQADVMGLMQQSFNALLLIMPTVARSICETYCDRFRPGCFRQPVIRSNKGSRPLCWITPAASH
jgi:hypothetical protein